MRASVSLPLLSVLASAMRASVSLPLLSVLVAVHAALAQQDPCQQWVKSGQTDMVTACEVCKWTAPRQVAECTVCSMACVDSQCKNVPDIDACVRQQPFTTCWTACLTHATPQQDAPLFWACVLTLLAVAACGLYRGFTAFARSCERGPPPPSSWVSQARARWYAEHLAEWLKCTGTFDGLLAECLEIEKLEPDGTLLASFTPKGPLLSDAGGVHEGALALLADSVTSFGAEAAGHLNHLSIEIGVTLLAPVPVGERLVVRTRVSKVHTGAVISLGMELRRAAPSDEEEGELLATGHHLKSMKATDKDRRWHGFLVRCLPFYKCSRRRGMPKAQLSLKESRGRRRDPETKTVMTLAELRWHYWGQYTEREIDDYWRDCCEPVEAPSLSDERMEALLALRPEEGDAGAEGTTVRAASISPWLHNIWGISHGAATASLLCTAAKEHASRMREPPAVPVIKSFSMHYLAPVPGGGAPVRLVVRQQPPPKFARSEDKDTVSLLAELHFQDSPLARGTFTVRLPEPPRPSPAPAPTPLRPQARPFGANRFLHQRLLRPGPQAPGEAAAAAGAPLLPPPPPSAEEPPEPEDEEEEEWLRSWREGRSPPDQQGEEH